MQKIAVKTALHRAKVGTALHLEGWIRTCRDNGSVLFVSVNDGSCLNNLQVVIDRNQLDASLLKNLDFLKTGTAAWFEGLLVESPAAGQDVELHVSSLGIFGRAEEDYPLQKKRHSFEFLREISHLRPRSNTFGAIARVRQTASWAIHRFFAQRDFIQCHTPIITSFDAEGAGSVFRVSVLDPFEENSQQEDFFGKPTFLTVSGQLHAEAYALALGKVYTFGPTFRAENSQTVRHLAEFWMIEPELAFADLETIMDLAEDFLKDIISTVLEECSEDMAFFAQRIEPGLLEKLQTVLNRDFTRISYTEAINLLEKKKELFEFPVFWGAELQTEHEKYLSEVIFEGPVIVTDYPKDIKAFYMKQNEDGKTVRAMDILFPRLGEIIGGSQREDHYDVLKKSIELHGLPIENYSWYLDLRRHGSVPHAGFGLGFERLLQYLTGMINIRDVIPFPRTSKRISF